MRAWKRSVVLNRFGGGGVSEAQGNEVAYGYLYRGSLAAARAPAKGRGPTPQRADAAIRNIRWDYHH